MATRYLLRRFANQLRFCEAKLRTTTVYGFSFNVLHWVSPIAFAKWAWEWRLRHACLERVKAFFDMKRWKFVSAKLSTFVLTLPCKPCRVITYAVWAAHELMCLHRFCKKGKEPKIPRRCLHSFCKACIDIGFCDMECLHRFCEKLFAYVLQRLHSVFGFAQCTILLNLYALGHGASRRIRGDLTFDSQ